MKNKSLKNTKAFTLVELLTTISIFTFVMGAVYTIFLVSNKSWATFSNNMILQHDVREGMIAMTKELRRAHGFFLVQEPGNMRLNFLRYPVGMVSYTWSDSGENAYKIMRRNNENIRILTSDIKKFSLELLSDAVVIDLTASKALPTGEKNEFELKSKIALRSKIYENNEH